MGAYSNSSPSPPSSTRAASDRTADWIIDIGPEAWPGLESSAARRQVYAACANITAAARKPALGLDPRVAAGTAGARGEGEAERFDRLEGKVDGLVKALSGIVGDAVREANRVRDRKP